MKVIAALALSCILAIAQVQLNPELVRGFDTQLSARTIRGGTGDPSAGLCTSLTVRSVYVRSDIGSTSSPLFVCSNTGVGTYAWVQISGGGGGGATEGDQACPEVTYTVGTLTVNLALTDGGKICTVFSTLMQANPTLAFTNPSLTRAVFHLIWVQDGTGGRSVTFPGSSVGLCQPATAANSVTIQTVYYNGSAYRGGVCTEVGGSGLSLSSANDFKLTYTSGTVQTIGSTCSVASPCVSSVNNVPQKYTAPGTLTITAGSGNADVRWCLTGATVTPYLNVTSGSITLTAGGSGVSASVVGSSCPSSGLLLWLTTITGGSWDALTGSMDYRSRLSQGPVITGGGCVTVTGSGTATVNVDGSSCGGATADWTSSIGSWFPMGFTATSIGTTISANNKVVCMEYTAPFTVTFGAVGIRGSTVTSGFAEAFYDSAGNLLQQTATSTSGGSQQIALAATVTFSGGTTFFHCHTAAVAGDTFIVTATGLEFANLATNLTTKRFFEAQNSSTGTTTLTFPATLGATRSAVVKEVVLVGFLR